MPDETESHSEAHDRVNPDELTPELLIRAYCNGAFPMADPTEGRVYWYCPDPRGVLPLDGFHVPKSLRRVVRTELFEIRCDCDFEGVVRACAAQRPDQDEAATWINETLIDAYVGLFAMGCARSVEAYLDGRLVGGLYGVQLNGGFFGESMFSRPEWGGTNASKVCLVHLAAHLKKRDMCLLDTQFVNEHLQQFGCVEIPRDAYLEQLEAALHRDVSWGKFEASPQDGSCW